MNIVMKTNDAIHAGKIDPNEETARTLFYLVNDIAHAMLTKPREMDKRYSSLPAGKREQIETRDKKTK